ncbi:MAG: signal peptidase I [Tannerellaceae bacterium]|jgi:signal peptidase I|nr:signal peptidase I [Tannerellaceae bacterium]
MSRKGIILRTGVNIAFYSCVAAVAWLLVQVFVFASFVVPTGSMSPSILPGDYVLVDKLTFGARLFNILPALRLEQVAIHRAPGLRAVRRGDVVVFNNPYPNNGERMEMHILRYLVKRCTGLPGDSLLIEDGRYRVKGADGQLWTWHGEHIAHLRDSLRDMFFEPALNYFPNDSIIGWDALRFGPLYIPRRGDVIPMNRDSYVLYKKLIERETKGELTFRDSTVYLDNSPIRTYIFESDYYFMSGDNADDSLDSRYWGLTPGDYIVGKAWVVWKSTDSYTGKFRAERWLKRIS